MENRTSTQVLRDDDDRVVKKCTCGKNTGYMKINFSDYLGTCNMPRGNDDAYNRVRERERERGRERRHVYVRTRCGTSIDWLF